MDVHLSQSNSLFKNKKVFKKDFFPQNNCLHSRKIMSLLDFPEEAKKYRSFEKHVEACGDCQKQYIAAQHYLRLADEAIPAFCANEETIESLNTEMSEIFSRIDFTSQETTFVQKGAWFKKTEAFFEDFFNVVISWKMIPVYFGAGTLFVLLTHF